MVHGLVVTAATTGAFVVGFQEWTESTIEIRRNLLTTCLGLLTVWGPSALFHLRRLAICSRQSSVPGENFRCDECGEDLRGKISADHAYCPNCKSFLSSGVRKTLSTINAEDRPIQMPSKASSAGASTSPSEKDAEQSE